MHVLADCVIVSVRPATVAVPERLDVVLLTATVTVAVPFPSPDPPVSTVIHETLLVVDHAHPVAAVTVVDAGPPAAATVSVPGEIE